ncbi:hypothetical protein V2J09_008338 [Rumex salicifolius]
MVVRARATITCSCSSLLMAVDEGPEDSCATSEKREIDQYLGKPEKEVKTYQNPGCERVRGTSIRENIERNLGRRVLRLAKRGAKAGALKALAIEVDHRLEPRRVVRTLPNGGVGRQVEAATLC